MGADIIITCGYGESPEEAFQSAVEEALHECGHGGYTGTIAEKDSYAMIDVPNCWKPEKYAQHLLDNYDPRVSDKWGPAGCLKVSENVYLFFGWASS